MNINYMNAESIQVWGMISVQWFEMIAVNSTRDIREWSLSSAIASPAGLFLFLVRQSHLFRKKTLGSTLQSLWLRKLALLHLYIVKQS